MNTLDAWKKTVVTREKEEVGWKGVKGRGFQLDSENSART